MAAVPLKDEAPLRLLQLHDHAFGHRDRQAAHLHDVPEPKGLCMNLHNTDGEKCIDVSNEPLRDMV